METVTRSESKPASGRAPYRGKLLPRRREEEGRGNGNEGSQGLATALGWFSIGLGVAEIVAPEQVARWIGIDEAEGRTIDVVRLMGLREIGAGIGILANESRPPRWMWARVAGDALDLALLARAGATEGARKQRTALATLAVLGVTALDIISAQRLEGREVGEKRTEPKGIHVRRSITVDRPREEVYRFWHDFENLPRFMKHLEEVHVTGPGRSHWKATAPARMTVEWDAQTTDDIPNERIAWRSVEGAQVDNTGEVRFTDAPGGRGTEIHVDIRYDPPGGKVTAALAKLFHEEPDQQVIEDLRRFKQVMEVGEVVVSDATVGRGPHPARPPKSSKEER